MRKRLFQRALFLTMLVMLTGCASIQTRVSSCQRMLANTFSANNRISRKERQALLTFDAATNGGIAPAAVGSWPCKSVPPPCQWSGVTCTSGHVTDLYLFGKNLSGEIPPELGDLSELQVLILSNNQLSGVIPVELGNLSQLEFLYLDNNQLSGRIPVELGSLSQLHWLNLDNNQLSGPFPHNVAELPLEGLRLSNTGLCIPQTTELETWIEGIGDRDFEAVPYCE